MLNINTGNILPHVTGATTKILPYLLSVSAPPSTTVPVIFKIHILKSSLPKLLIEILLIHNYASIHWNSSSLCGRHCYAIRGYFSISKVPFPDLTRLDLCPAETGHFHSPSYCSSSIQVAR